MTKPGLDGSDKGGDTGFVHISFSVGSKEKVDEFIEMMEKEGFEIAEEASQSADGFYEGCLIDLEGNEIEVTV